MAQICAQCNGEPNVNSASLLKCAMMHAISLVWQRALAEVAQHEAHIEMLVWASNGARSIGGARHANNPDNLDYLDRSLRKPGAFAGFVV